jgi:transposase InsO family protein
LCKQLKISRQSYYQSRVRNSRGKKLDDKLIHLVQPIRQLMPRLGGRKLHFMIQGALAENQIQVGRDRFFRWLGAHDLLIRPKRRYVYTTQSFHRFWIYDNLTENIALTGPNQLWVSDITYLRTREGFCYLALITDAFSRKIVGYDVSDSLELQGCLRALKSALHNASDLTQLIHHSDRGIQYCSGQYTELLKAKNIKISMAEKGNCYQNALAERVNGILKDEFHLDINFKNKNDAIQTTHQSIYIYNQHRPHWGLGLKTPQYCHAA